VASNCNITEYSNASPYDKGTCRYLNEKVTELKLATEKLPPAFESSENLYFARYNNSMVAFLENLENLEEPKDQHF